MIWQNKHYAYRLLTFSPYKNQSGQSIEVIISDATVELSVYFGFSLTIWSNIDKNNFS